MVYSCNIKYATGREKPAVLNRINACNLFKKRLSFKHTFFSAIEIDLFLKKINNFVKALTPVRRVLN